MIIIDNILVSDDIVEKQFVCDLAKCKGGCCEEGDAGAPLEKEELAIIDDVYDKVKPYLTKPAVQAIDKKGRYVFDKEFGWVTPTLESDNEICVYGKRDAGGTIKCAFEQAFYDGVIEWKKPVSCHLFPVIADTGRKGGLERLNYEPRERLCSPACALGKKLKVPVYEFLKEPLTRKYGAGFYNALERVAQMQSEKKAKQS